MPAPLDKLLDTGSRRRVDGGAGRVAFQLLAALGISGWSARLDLQSAVNTIRRTSQANGAYVRAWRALKQAGLYETHTAFFGGRPVVIARLTDLGRTLLAQAGVPVVPRNGSASRPAIAGPARGSKCRTPRPSACSCTSAGARLRHGGVPARGFRRRGTGCPHHAGGRPDLCGGTAAGRRGLAPGAQVASPVRAAGLRRHLRNNPKLAQELAAEAQVAGVGIGYVTDLATLARDAPVGLWTHCWRSQHSPLERGRKRAVAADEALPGLTD